MHTCLLHTAAVALPWLHSLPLPIFFVRNLIVGICAVGAHLLLFHAALM
jgi:hypothetical protein